jgi:hypothetical protein
VRFASVDGGSEPEHQRDVAVPAIGGGLGASCCFVMGSGG